jgi:hypothetical protein
MKCLLCVITIALLTAPLLAQDDTSGGDLLGGDGGFFGGDSVDEGNRRGGGSGGRGPQTVDRLVNLRTILAQANVPLTRDQERALGAMLETEIKKYVVELEKQFPEEAAAARAGGQRGADRPVPIRQNPMALEMRRMNEELQTNVVSSLKPEQQTVIRKFLNDQIRRRGGLDALKLTMEEAGAPLTAEQMPQIQALYDEQNQARMQLLRQSQGSPDASMLRQIELQTMTKVVRLLNAVQRKALQDSMAKAKN